MNRHTTEEAVAAELSRVLVPVLAKAAVQMRGKNARFEMRFLVQKDMWDNYGDYLRLTLASPLPGCVSPAGLIPPALAHALETGKITEAPA